MIKRLFKRLTFDIKMACQYRLRLGLTITGITLSVFLFILAGIMIDSRIMKAYENAASFPEDTLAIYGDLTGAEFDVLDRTEGVERYGVYTNAVWSYATYHYDDGSDRGKNCYVYFNLMGTDEDLIHGIIPESSSAVVTEPLIYGESLEGHGGENVVVISQYCAETLFGSIQDAVGETIRVYSMNIDMSRGYAMQEYMMFIVCGIIKNQALDRDSDKLILKYTDSGSDYAGDRIEARFNAYIPLDTYRNIYPVYGTKGSAVKYATAIAHLSPGNIVSERRVREELAGGPSVVSRATIVQDAYYSIKQYRLIFAVIILFVSLFSGINIVNVMLFAVKERTGEISIRKTMGATNMDIMYQILIESCFMAMVSWGLAALLAYVITHALYFALFSSLCKTFSLSITLTTFVSGFLFAIIMGTVSGVIPAVIAARQPIASSLRRDI